MGQSAFIVRYVVDSKVKIKNFGSNMHKAFAFMKATPKSVLVFSQVGRTEEVLATRNRV